MTKMTALFSAIIGLSFGFTALSVRAEEHVITAKEIKSRCLKNKKLKSDDQKNECFQNILSSKDSLETDAILFINQVCNSRLSLKQPWTDLAVEEIHAPMMVGPINETTYIPKWGKCVSQLLDFVDKYKTEKTASLDYKIGMILNIRGDILYEFEPSSYFYEVDDNHRYEIGDLVAILCPGEARPKGNAGDACVESIRQAYAKTAAPQKALAERSAREAAEAKSKAKEKIQPAVDGVR